jgi:glycosyltransferase involved in cell wall biosynthesis
MPATLLSVLVPLYNEEEFVAPLIERVLLAPLPEGMEREIIVVDDGSRDGSAEIVAELAARHPEVRLVRHERNRGKGAAICTAIELARGDYSIIQDADLEYDPDEFKTLIEPIVSGRADVVFGSRFLGGPHRVLYFWHSIGNRVLTLLSNMFTDLNLSDMETCYKVFRREIVQAIPIEENRFGFEPEITVKVAKRRLRIYEVGISYWGRTYEEGKKIGWKDGVRCLWCLLKYSIKERAVILPQSATSEPEP